MTFSSDFSRKEGTFPPRATSSIEADGKQGMNVIEMEEVSAVVLTDFRNYSFDLKSCFYPPAVDNRFSMRDTHMSGR